MRRIKKHPHAGHSGPVRDFIKVVHEMADHRRHSEVFDDFLELGFCAIAKSTHKPDSSRAEELEEQYMRRVRQRSPEYIRRIPELLGILAVAHGEPGGAGDFLGKVSGELGALNESTGQYFTPYEVSRLMAKMTLDNDETRELVRANGFVTVCEPCSGAGGMALAAAGTIEEMGLDPSYNLFIEATDVSYTAFLMTYIQLAVRGVPAHVRLGNSLSMEIRQIEVTPALFPFVAKNAAGWLRWRSGAEQAASPAAAVSVTIPKPEVSLGQIRLFP